MAKRDLIAQLGVVSSIGRNAGQEADNYASHVLAAEWHH
jgi:hypothetical protein